MDGVQHVIQKQTKESPTIVGVTWQQYKDIFENFMSQNSVYNLAN